MHQNHTIAFKGDGHQKRPQEQEKAKIYFRPNSQENRPGLLRGRYLIIMTGP